MDFLKNNKSLIIRLLEDIKDYLDDNDTPVTRETSRLCKRIETLLYDLQTGQPG